MTQQTSAAVGSMWLQALSAILFLIILAPSAAQAKQCIKNDSGVSLNVTWYNANGKVDKNASKSDLTLGFQACQNNAQLGFAVIKCNGCGVAVGFSKGLVVVGGAVAVVGICSASAVACEVAIDVAAVGLSMALAEMHQHRGKLLAAPLKGKTVRVTGTAFQLELKK